MYTIIAGSRTITNMVELETAVKASGFTITKVACGGASGVDSLGASYAMSNNIPIVLFKPDWDTYGKAAGPIRNQLMAESAEALILIYDGKSRGSADMLIKATAKGLKIHTHIVKAKE